MALSAREQRIVREVEALEDEILDFASRLVAQPSVLGGEFGAVEVMERMLARLGLDPVRVPIDPDALAGHPGFAPTPWSYDGRENVLAVRPADASGGRSALFNGHLDVVSPEPLSFWKTDPFEPVVKDGRMYGRGSGDMKSGVAAMTFALHAVTRAGFGLRAPVTLEGVIEEECSGNGALACLAAGYDAEAVLIPEPFGPTILTNQVGVLWFKVLVRGEAKHVLEAGAGTNAIEKSFRIIEALRELEAEMNACEFPEPYKDFEHPLNLNIGVMLGGDWPSTVPAECELHGRLSYFPGEEFADTAERIVEKVRRAAESDPWLAENLPEVEFYGFRSGGVSVPLDLPAFKTLGDCHKDLTGEEPEEYIATCTTDVRAFHFHGQGRATCYGPVAENIHGANECVLIDSVIHTAKAYALFLARWCGLVE